MSRDSKAAVLIAEDSQFDQMVLRRAFTSAGIQEELRFVSDGEDLLSYLRQSLENPEQLPYPCIVLLDLHMPRMDGREALMQIRQDERLKHLPVIMLTSSDSDKHVREFYGLGANSYVVKPNNFDDLVHAIRQLKTYWFGVAKLPTII